MTSQAYLSSLETLPERTANFKYDVKGHAFLMFCYAATLYFYAPFIIFSMYK